MFAAGLSRRLNAVVEALMRLCRLLSILIIGWLALILVVNVLTRYALNFSLSWVDESSSLLLVWLTLTVAPLGFHENFHIAVNIISDSAPRRLGLAVRMLSNLAIILFFSITFYYGILSSLSEMRMPLFSIPIARGWATWILPASSAVIILVCIDNMLKLALADGPAARALRADA
jgi:TRAP-type C4-dicarboxylate transport system permease small subunit